MKSNLAFFIFCLCLFCCSIVYGQVGGGFQGEGYVRNIVLADPPDLVNGCRIYVSSDPEGLRPYFAIRFDSSFNQYNANKQFIYQALLSAYESRAKVLVSGVITGQGYEWDGKMKVGMTYVSPQTVELLNRRAFEGELVKLEIKGPWYGWNGTWGNNLDNAIFKNDVAIWWEHRSDGYIGPENVTVSYRSFGDWIPMIVTHVDSRYGVAMFPASTLQDGGYWIKIEILDGSLAYNAKRHIHSTTKAFVWVDR